MTDIQPATASADGKRQTAETRYYIPTELKQQGIWAIWSPEFGKQIMAPWTTGHCYPAAWGEGKRDRPETDFETAKMVADLPPKEVHRSYPFPSDDHGAPKIPDRILPTIMLPHQPPDPPIMLVDLDDVRDPDTGHITEEVRTIVQRLNAYCEVSSSGTGLHLFVRAELPGQLGKFIAPLDDHGDIELYDHGRVVGATWQHVPWTSTDVPERQDVIDELVSEYETEAQEKRRLGTAAGVDPDEQSASDRIDGLRSDSSDVSDYFEIDVTAIADTGPFRRYRDKAPGHKWQGPHPAHGPQHSDPEDCTNFGVQSSHGTWYCFAHDSGGRALDLAAVLCPHTDVRCDDVPKKAATKRWILDRPETLLITCLWLRDQGVVVEAADPPLDALTAVAELVGLDTSGEVLDRSTRSVARSVYGDLTAQEVAQS